MFGFGRVVFESAVRAGTPSSSSGSDGGQGSSVTEILLTRLIKSNVPSLTTSPGRPPGAVGTVILLIGPPDGNLRLH